MRLMTAAEAAAEYGIPSAKTLRTMRRNGLPSVKLGRAHLFLAEDIEAFILAEKTSNRPSPQGVALGTADPAASVRAAMATAAALKKLPRK